MKCSSTETPLIFVSILDSIIGKKYCFVGQKFDYSSAIENCKNQSGVLFEPRSENENHNVYWLFLEYIEDYIWIGITDRDSEGFFVYVSNSEPIIYQNWGTNQPDGLMDEDCVNYKPTSLGKDIFIYGQNT